MTRYTHHVGRFTVTDFFDNNRYSHDPRTQFMGWGVMYNGAWDYPADVRGYTWGWVHEFHARHWSLRYGSAAEPRVANGLRFDRRILRNRGDLFEGEGRYSLGDHPGAVRLLGYLHHANAGNYADAIRLERADRQAPDVTATRRNGTLKYGSGVNIEQEITEGFRRFRTPGLERRQDRELRIYCHRPLGESAACLTGTRWKRKYDTVASAFTASGLSAVHAQYLARGGLDFLIGDGALRYGAEKIWESYYSARLFPGFFATIDVQQIWNPAYNQDRGPVWVGSPAPSHRDGQALMAPRATASPRVFTFTNSRIPKAPSSRP